MGNAMGDASGEELFEIKSKPQAVSRECPRAFSASPRAPSSKAFTKGVLFTHIGNRKHSGSFFRALRGESPPCSTDSASASRSRYSLPLARPYECFAHYPIFSCRRAPSCPHRFFAKKAQRNVPLSLWCVYHAFAWSRSRICLSSSSVEGLASFSRRAFSSAASLSSSALRAFSSK